MCRLVWLKSGFQRYHLSFSIERITFLFLSFIGRFAWYIVWGIEARIAHPALHKTISKYIWIPSQLCHHALHCFLGLAACKRITDHFNLCYAAFLFLVTWTYCCGLFHARHLLCLVHVLNCICQIFHLGKHPLHVLPSIAPPNGLESSETLQPSMKYS